MKIEEAVEQRLLRKLWLSVLKRAGDDAEGQELFVPKAEVEKTVRLARRYLTTNSRSLQHVCYLGDLTGEQVKVIVEQARRRYNSELATG